MSAHLVSAAPPDPIVIPKRGAGVSATKLDALERQVAQQLPSVTDLEVLEEWRDQARALEGYLRDKLLQGPALGIQRRVEARIGELLGEAKRGVHAESLVTDSGVPKHDRSDFRVLAKAGKGEVELEDEEWRKSRRGLVALVRQRAGLVADAPPLPEGSHRCIVADPPWQLTTGATMPGKFGDTAIKVGNDALTYSQMSLGEIKALPVEGLAAPDAHLYLWTVNRYLEDAYDVAREWGFEPSTLLTWCKAPMGVGLGGTFRQTSEFCLFARRGTLQAERVVERTWWEWPRGKHSVKPDAFYELVETVSPGPRVDLFARRERPGWVAWGNEVADAAHA